MLSEGFVDADGYGVGEVEGAKTVAHGNADTACLIRVDEILGKTGAFAAKEQIGLIAVGYIRVGH